MERVYFDVGANDGESLLSLAKDSPQNVVYAFEPVPRMIDIINQKTKHLRNYIIVPMAVSDYDGEAEFKISGQADWGCSSLNDFNDNLKETWPGRTDFGVTETIKVKVIRLDDFCRKHDIQEIEYLHVDVQGSDLEVLMGLGDMLRIVKAGVIEMPTRHETKLYKNQKYIVQDAIEFLTQRGFTVTRIQSNDQFSNEVNVFFQRIIQ